MTEVTQSPARRGARQGLQALQATEHMVTAEDVLGSIRCPHAAQQLIGMPVDFNFQGHGIFSGTVTGFDVKEEHAGAILHVVTFTDGDVEEYSFNKIISANRQYLAARCPSDVTKPIVLNGAAREPMHVLQDFSLPPPAPCVLPLTAGLASYPLRIPLGNDTVQVRIVEHQVTAAGEHRYRAELPVPFENQERWLDTAELHNLISSGKKCRISAPARSTPTLTPFLNFCPIVDGTHWTSRHALVGLIVNVHLSTTVNVVGQGGKKSRTKPMHTVTIEAVHIASQPGSKEQYWGRIHDDLNQSVIFLDAESLACASHSNDVERFSKRHRSRNQIRGGGPTDALGDAATGGSFGDAGFTASLQRLADLIPTEAHAFFGMGFRIASTKVPRAALSAYRRGLGYIARALCTNPDDEVHWKLLLLYDGLILAPYSKGESFKSAIQKRVKQFAVGDWQALMEGLKCRNSTIARTSDITLDDPLDVLAQRAERELILNHSVGGAAKAIRAPASSRPSSVGQLTKTFQQLNPQVGDQAPPIPRSPSETIEEITGTRREIGAPAHSPTEPIVFTTAQVMKRVRRANTSSAGGLNGSTYKTLRCWFDQPDEVSDSLTQVINLITAGKVPRSIVPLLNAGRGVAIPKNEEGDLRPIVVGYVLMRLIGSLGVAQQADEIRAYFLQPVAIQFGVGVSGGCELMATAISTLLHEHPEYIDVAGDAKNAFNTWDRSQLWDVLLARFPSLFELVKLMYGTASEIVFSEPGGPATSILNSIGSRQGCSLGSFLYCLAIHPVLIQLCVEFPDLMILAFCDDVHFVGPPARAFLAYKRYSHLYAKVFQGSLRDDKGKVYSPSISAEELGELGLPLGMPVSSEGTRVLGAPIGSLAFCQQFTQDRINEVKRDTEILGRMRSLQVQHIVATKSILHRINHLLRNIPGGELEHYGHLAAVYDDMVMMIPRRFCRMPVLPEIARRIAALPPREGGLGIRTWSTTADSAYLASYVHASQQFRTLFPSISHLLPDVRTLLRQPQHNEMGVEAPRATPSPSPLARYAAHSLTRLMSKAPGVLERLDSVKSSRELQHDFSKLVDAAEAIVVQGLIRKADNPTHPRGMALYHSNCGDSVTWTTTPCDDLTTISNKDWYVLVRRRLLLPIYPISVGEKLKCPCCHVCSDIPVRDTSPAYPEVCEMGDHSLRCQKASSLYRTQDWHDPLVRVYYNMAKNAGLDCSHEPEGAVANSGKRPDLTVTVADGREVSWWGDVRTCVSSLAQSCGFYSRYPGGPSDHGATDKHRAWDMLAASNNTRVVPLCHEDGGRMGNESHDFIVRLAVAAGLHEADRRAFITYWTQRLCITNQKGIAKVLDKMRPITAAPHVLEQVTRNIGVPNARPLGKLASHASARRPGEGNSTIWGSLVIAAFQERTQQPAAPLIPA